jgi:FkbM family methyltransferase
MIQYIIYKLLHIFISNHKESKIVNLLFKNNKFLKNKNNLPIVIFDIGCFRGDWSRNILKAFKKKTSKQAMIYLFDVNPKSEIYLKSLLKNRNFKFNNIALDDEKSVKEFNFNTFFECSGSSLDDVYKNDKAWVRSRKIFLRFFSIKKIKNFSKITVNTDTIDNYCSINNINEIDILKIDVEGSEKRVLLGAEKTLKKVKIIYTEIVENKNFYSEKEKEIINFLNKNNFPFLEKKNIKSVSFFSNVIAKDNIFINKSFL